MWDYTDEQIAREHAKRLKAPLMPTSTASPETTEAEYALESAELDVKAAGAALTGARNRLLVAKRRFQAAEQKRIEAMYRVRSEQMVGD